MTLINEFESTKSLLFLTWADCHDRLDTLLIELRHLQENIIYLLKEPILYEILEHEQTYLHPDKYADPDLISTYPKPVNDQTKMDDETYAIRRFVEEAMISFPALDVGNDENIYENKCKSPNYYKDTEYCSKRKKVREKCRGLWRDHSWNSEQKKHYYLLRACQSVKQSILEDKLWLVHYSKNLFPDLCDKKERDKKYLEGVRKFLTARSAIKKRMSSYVKRLGEMQSVLKGSLDIGLHDHTRPLVERHKEQNIFNRFLSHHCVTLQRQLNRFAANISGKPDAGKEYQVGTINIHCSDFDSTSHYFSSNSTESRHDLGRDSVHHILTSFWMPERPDLVPIIAHEMAHSIHRTYWENSTVNDDDSSFSKVMHSLELLTANHGVYRELAVDMLALAIQGPAYLYAMFLELVCQGEEIVFSFENMNVDLSLNHSTLFTELKDCHLVDRQWYLRLHVACRWMEILLNSYRKTNSGDMKLNADEVRFAQGLITGIRAVSEDFLNGASVLLKKNDREKSKTQIDQLKRLTKDVIAVLDDCFTKREGKEKTAVLLDDNELSNTYRGKESSVSLDKELSIFLCRGLIRRKMSKLLKKNENGQSEASAPTQPVEKTLFDSVFGMNITPNCNTSAQHKCGECKKTGLFRQLQAIPWECSFLRGLEAMHSKSPLKEKSVPKTLVKMKEDLSLGREFYQIALDFHLSGVARRYTDMADIVRTLESLGAYSPAVMTRKRDSQTLKAWLGPELEQNENENENEIINLLNTLDKNDVANYEMANKFSAKAIGHAYVHTNNLDRLNKLTTLYCYKLLILHNLVKRLMEGIQHGQNKEIKKTLPILQTIRTAVSTKYDSTDQNLQQLNIQKFMDDARKAYLKQVFSVFNRPDSEKGCPKHYPNGVYTLGRLCMSAVHLLKTNVDTPLYFVSSKKVKEKETASTECFFPLLGRYDHFVLKKARPIFRNSVIAMKGVNNGENDYLPYFVRWETAVPLQLYQADNSRTQNNTESPILNGTPVGLLSVTMDRTELRLDMVHRLNSILQMPEKDFIKGTYIEQLRGLLQPEHDKLFLSDGWGDLLFIFCVKEGASEAELKDRLTDVFEIQNCLYQDFLVERTELILTPKCFDVAAKNYNDYRCSIHMRVEKDKSILPGNELFLKGVTKNLTNLTVNGKDYFTLTKTPGRFDFFCRLRELPDELKLDKVNVYHKLTEALLKPYDKNENNQFKIRVDRLQTNVKKVVYALDVQESTSKMNATDEGEG